MCNHVDLPLLRQYQRPRAAVTAAAHRSVNDHSVGLQPISALMSSSIRLRLIRPKCPAYTVFTDNALSRFRLATRPARPCGSGGLEMGRYFALSAGEGSSKRV